MVVEFTINSDGRKDVTLSAWLFCESERPSKLASESALRKQVPAIKQVPALQNCVGIKFD